MYTQKRTSKNGEVSYLIRVSLGYRNGKQTVKSFTWKPESDMTPKAIEKELKRQEVLFEEKAKKDYQEQIELENYDDLDFARKHTTFQMLAEEWFSLQKETHKMKNGSLIRMISCKDRTYNALGNCLVSDLTYRKVQKFITSLGKEGVNQKTGGGLSEKTQRHYLTFVSNVMIFAKKNGLIFENPCRDITFTKTPSKPKKVYTLEEVKRILAAIDEKAPLKYRLFFNILAYSGMRKAEVLGLELKDVNFKKSLLSVRRNSNYQQGYGVYTDTTKTSSSNRTLYVQDKILGLITQMQAELKQQAAKCGDQWVDTDRLFVSWNGKPLQPNAPYKWLQRFCEKENLPFKALHSFRHFVASQALFNGVDLPSVSSMLGHSQTSTTLNFYAHAVQNTNERALNSVASSIEGKD